MNNENEPKTEYEFYKQQYENLKKKAAHKDAKQLEEEIRSVSESLADKASGVKHSVLWEEVKRHSETAIKAYLTITGLESNWTDEDMLNAMVAAASSPNTSMQIFKEYLKQLKEKP